MMSQVYIFLKSIYLFTKIFIEGLLHARHMSRCKCRKYHDLFTWLPDNEHLGHLQCFALISIITMDVLLRCASRSSFARGSLR